MRRSGAREWAAVLGFVLAAVGGTAWAQAPEQPLNVTGRLLFGYGDLSQNSYTESGPASTLETDFSGFWRDPRILEFDVKPMVTVGVPVPGTDMGSPVTGFSAMGTFLGGSEFPLSLSYSRFSSPLGNYYTGGTGDVLNGAEGKTINSTFEVQWRLRFKHWPTVSLEYRDTDYNSDLPQALGGEEDRSLNQFTAHINYIQGGWVFAGRYQRSQFTTTTPDIVTGGVENENGTTSDLGFTASRSLPLHSSLGVNADQSKSDFSANGLDTDLTARTANVILTSRPLDRLYTTVQMQYSSNLQASEVQQALAGAGVPGASASPTSVSTGPFTYLEAPYKVLNFNGTGSFRLGHGLSVNGSAGESQTSPGSGTSTQWSAGLTYNRKWHSGWFTTSYSYSRLTTEAEVLNEIASAGTLNAPQSTDTYSLFSQVLDLNSVAGSLTENLPDQFRLSTSAQVSEGTLQENGVPYPYHSYGGLASLTRPVGQWTLTASFNLNETAAYDPLTYNQSTAKAVTFGAAYKGLNVSGGYQYGSGLAEQIGSSVVYVNNPQAVSPVLGIPILSSTSGTILNGNYRSRRGRLMLTGYFFRFHYTADNVANTEYNLFNLHASYKLRRLRLIAGYVKNSQSMGAASSGLYENRLMFFEVERVFRLR